MDLAVRVKQKREEKKFSQKELGLLCGLAQQSINKIEKGKSLNPRTLSKIALALGTTAEYLQFGILSNVRNNQRPALKNSLPLINWVQAGAWTNKLKELDMKYYQCPVDCSENSFILEVKVVSMEPMFKEGDHIFIDQKAKYGHKDYVIAMTGESEQVIFKQLIIEDNKKFLKSVNPDWLEKFIEIDDKCKIIGKLIYKGEIF